MARCQAIDFSQKVLVVALSDQLPPGTVEYACKQLFDHELGLCGLDER